MYNWDLEARLTAAQAYANKKRKDRETAQMTSEEVAYQQWVDAQDECEHEWQSTGYNPDWGTIYECDKCGGITP